MPNPNPPFTCRHSPESTHRHTNYPPQKPNQPPFSSRSPSNTIHNKVYFENFPNSHGTKAMELGLSKYGISGKVYVAHKCNKRNLNFGFLTIDGSLSMHEVLYRMNSVWIGNVRLQAFKSRYYYRNPIAAPAVLNRKIAKELAKKSRVFHESSRDHHSYAPVVNSLALIDSVLKLDSVSTSPPWISCSCLVRVRKINIIPNLFSAVRDRNFALDFIAPVGGNQVVLCFYSMDAKLGFMELDFLSIQNLVNDLREYPIDFIPDECLMYADFLGIPPAILSKSLIVQLAGFFGKLITLDFDFDKPARLDVVSCLLSVPTGLGNQSINIQVRDVIISVKISFRQAIACCHVHAIGN